LKRIVLTKIFAGYLFVLAAYAFYIINTRTILGVRGTAPYSEWSFCDFLTMISLPLNTILLFFVSVLFTKRERNTRKILLSTPLYDRFYLVTLAVAPVCAYLIAAILAITVCFGSYAGLFSYENFCSLLPFAAVLLLPQMFLFLGIGLLFCRIRPEAAYVIIAFLLFISFIGLVPPTFLDVTGISLIKSIDNTIPVNAVIPFNLSWTFKTSRVFITFLGSVICALSLNGESTNTAK